MSESSLSPLCVVEVVGRLPFNVTVPGDDELRDSLSVVDGLRLIAEVDEDNADFSAVVGIDGSWRVEHGEPPFECQSASWPDLAFNTFGQGDVYSCGYECALEGL